MSTTETINWDVERERFERVAYPFALRAAKRAFKGWHERKRDDAEAEFLAKVWDQWERLLDKGQDPEPLLWPCSTGRSSGSATTGGSPVAPGTSTSRTTGPG